MYIVLLTNINMNKNLRMGFNRQCSGCHGGCAGSSVRSMAHHIQMCCSVSASQGYIFASKEINESRRRQYN